MIRRNGYRTPGEAGMDPLSQNGESLKSAEGGPVSIFFGVSMGVELARTK